MRACRRDAWSEATGRAAATPGRRRPRWCSPPRGRGSRPRRRAGTAGPWKPRRASGRRRAPRGAAARCRSPVDLTPRSGFRRGSCAICVTTRRAAREGWACYMAGRRWR
jgi:hypothetical protein